MIFKTKDGTEFNNLVEAEKHEKDLMIIVSDDNIIHIGYRSENNTVTILDEGKKIIFNLNTEKCIYFKGTDIPSDYGFIYIIPYTFDNYLETYREYAEDQKCRLEDIPNSALLAYGLESPFKPLIKITKLEEVIYTKAKLEISGDYVAFHEMGFNTTECVYENEICKEDDGNYSSEAIVNAVRINGSLYIKLG